MKYFLLVFIASIIGCADNSPEVLKLQDEKIALCKEQCKPRDMHTISHWYGCQCKVEGEK